MKQGTVDLLGRVDESELIGLLKELVRIPSPTGNEEAISKFTSAYAKDMGATSVRVSDHWDVVARIDGASGGPTLLFLTHTDHSRVDNGEDAHAPDVVDGDRYGKPGRVVTGEGSCAPKGALAAMLYAGQMVAQRREDLAGHLIIAAVTRDLSANHDGVREVAEKGWIDADMAVVGEPSGNQPAIGARGINHVVITLRGSPTHWGNPEGGVNPIWAIEPILGVVEGLAGELPTDESLGKATLAPIDIRCDMSPPQTPHSCSLVLDRRTLPGEDPEAVVKVIREKLDVLRLEKLTIDIQVGSQMYPFQGSSESFVSRKIMEINEAVTGRRLPYGYLSFSSNGGYLTGRMKIPSVIYGPGQIEDLRPSEHIEVGSVVTAARVYTATAFEILQGD